MSRLVARGVDAVRALATSRTQAPLRRDGHLPRIWDDAFDALPARLEEQLLRLGPPPVATPPPSTALPELFDCSDTVSPEPRVTARTYKAELVQLTKTDHATVDLLPLLGPDALRIALEPERYILLPESEIDQEKVAGCKPYTDPLLKGTPAMVELAALLICKSLALARLTKSCTIGVFTVLKKGDWLRLIFDCRPANLQCRRPNYSHLSTASTFTQLRVDRKRTNDAGYEGSLAVLDLRDSFYLFRYELLSHLFALEGTYRAADVGVTDALDAEGNWVHVEPETLVYVCLSTLPMGFAWSLFFCHDVCTNVCLDALCAYGVPRDSARDQLLVDGRPAPRLSPTLPIAAPYVDNLNFLCWSRAAARWLCDWVDRRLTSLGLAHRVECVDAPAHDVVGLRLCLRELVAYNKPERVWKVRSATIALLAQGRCTGYAMQVVCGLLVNLGLVSRPFLSIFSHVFSFAVSHLGRIGIFNVDMRHELQTAIDFMLFLVASLEDRGTNFRIHVGFVKARLRHAPWTV